MRFKKAMSAVLTAAMLSSVLASVGAVSAGAEKAATVDDIDLSDYSSYTTYDGSDLGAVYTPASTTFKVWAPTSTDVALKLYATGSDAEEGAKALGDHPMTLDKTTGVWSVTVDGDLKNQYYTFYVKNEFCPDGKEVMDLYAKAAGVNGNRAMVVDLDSTDPEGWASDARQLVDSPTQAQVWELHVKDFSYDPESGVSEQYRGKYMAFTEFETTLNNAGDMKTCMSYLKDLGINYVQINPMYDFGSIDETSDDDTLFNGGYDPKNYNVPEGSYSTNPYDGNVRINEMKQMIKALHDNGIGVIMDVVYNHTYATENSWFNLTVPYYYYRQKPDGSWSGASGCGNDTASEREMFKKFMIESLHYWATEYHLDGFRFDLMGLHDSDTMNAIRDDLDTIDSRIIMYGEGWSMSSYTDDTNWAGNTTSLCNQAKAKRVSERIGFFNDSIRDGLKGKFNNLSAGYVSGITGGSGTIVKGIEGQYRGDSWSTKAPGQNIVYSCCHDNNTLWDRLVRTEFGSKPEKSVFDDRNEMLVASNKLSGAIVMTSQGIPFILAGEEFARTKYGDENSYRSPADVNMLDWSRAADYADIVSYYKGLIKLRNAYPGFADSTLDTAKAIEMIDAPKGVIAYNLPNLVDTSGKTWSNMVLIFNGSRTSAADVWLPGSSPAGGDVDGDGDVTSNDALLILRSSLELDTLTDDQKAAADLDGDGDITSNDALIALRISLGLEETPKSGAASGAADDTVYSVLVDRYTAGVKELATVSGKVTLEPSSTLILVPKADYDKVDLSDLFYENEGTVTVKHVDQDTNKVLRQYTITGSEGQYYTTQAASDLALEYDLIKVDGDASGKIKKGASEVTYTYKLFEGGVGTVEINYLNEKGQGLADTITLRGRAGDSYTSEEQSFPWYEIDTIPENASGTFVKGETKVDYIYKSSDKVYENTIHVAMGPNTDFVPNLHLWGIYDAATDNKNYGTTWPGVKMTDDDGDGWYEYSFKNGNGYNWIVNDPVGGSQTADMSSKGDIWVICNGSASSVEVYDHNPDEGEEDPNVVKGSLVVIHMDENGKEIDRSREKQAAVGTAYTTEPLDNDWYILDETKLPENAEGTYTDGKIEVVYYYTTVPTKTATVHVQLTEDAAFKPYLYFWGDGQVKGAPAWPGIAMTDEDGDGWYEYTIETIDKYNWILDDGKKDGAIQTGDHLDEVGDVWIVASAPTEKGISVTKEKP